MLNRDGIVKKQYGAPRQILANVDNQSSVGCIVSQELGTDIEGGIKLAKAGTPIHIDFMDLQKKAEKVTEGKAMNAVLLHDVDVSNREQANGTALYFGSVNVNCVDTDVAEAITTAQGITGASSLLVFGKF